MKQKNERGVEGTVQSVGVAAEIPLLVSVKEETGQLLRDRSGLLCLENAEEGLENGNMDLWGTQRTWQCVCDEHKLWN